MSDKESTMKESWSRRVMGALKDMTSIGIAKTSDRSALEEKIDIAVIKATRHKDTPPKEKHVLTALSATRAFVSRRHLIYAVEKRLTRTRDWKVALKTLALFHRLLREGAPAFAQELQHFLHRSVIEGMFSFEDRSSPFALDLSLWIRKYSCYLSQRIHVSRIFKYDVALENNRARINELDIQDILLYLPSLQLLLSCLLDCAPEEGRVPTNTILLYALDILVKECPNIYSTIDNSICGMLGSFYEDMTRHRAVLFLDIYKRNLQQFGRLEMFYNTCAGILTDGHIEFPSTNKPSELLLAEMEDYIKTRPHPASSEDWKVVFDNTISQTDSSVYLSADEMDKSNSDASNGNGTVRVDGTNPSLSDPPAPSFSDWLFTPTIKMADNVQPQQLESNDNPQMADTVQPQQLESNDGPQ